MTRVFLTGPLEPLQRLLDFLLDAAAFVVQGLVLLGTAIAAFFVQAAAFLVELGMAVIGAIGAFLGQVRQAVGAIFGSAPSPVRMNPVRLVEYPR